MTATSPATNLDNTNQVIIHIFYLLYEHWIITSIISIVLVIIYILRRELKKIREKAAQNSIPCKPVVLSFCDQTYDGIGKSGVAFFIGSVMFFIALVFDKHGGVPSIVVQTMTFMPTIGLAFSQIGSIRNSLSTLSKFI